MYTSCSKNGIYTEKVTVPSTKTFVPLVAQGVANTTLTRNANANTSEGDLCGLAFARRATYLRPT